MRRCGGNRDGSNRHPDAGRVVSAVDREEGEGMSDLKTCPFCGSKAESFSDACFCAEDGRKIAEIKWFVWCTECSALVSGESKEEALEAWNRRADV